MKETRKFNLERPARKAGGDRYQEIEESDKPIILGTVYVMQSISRSAGIPANSLTITIET